jgi:hypothetical protein
VITLPNDEPLIRELAFPQGMRVFVGPAPGRCGTVNWNSEAPMLRDYPNSVPVLMCGLAGRTHWFNKRWLAPLGEGAA